jgi:hypothetical protein
MRSSEYYRFASDVCRLRPLISVLVTVLLMVPNFVEMGTQSLSALTVLERLAASLAVVTALVWFVTGLLMHYAKAQFKRSLEEVEPG